MKPSAWLAIVVVAAAFCWAERWQVVGAAAGQSSSPSIYLVNRWTGAVKFCRMDDCMWAEGPAPPAK